MERTRKVILSAGVVIIGILFLALAAVLIASVARLFSGAPVLNTVFYWSAATLVLASLAAFVWDLLMDPSPPPPTVGEAHTFFQRPSRE